MIVIVMQIDESTLKNLYSHGRGLEVLVDKTIVFLGDSGNKIRYSIYNTSLFYLNH